MLNVGLIGYGTMGKVHAKAYQQLSNTKLVAIADLEPSEQHAASELDVEIFSSGEELLKMSKIDIVDICLPTYLHAKFVQEAAEKGCHVFCEKPLAISQSEAKNMLGISKKYPTKFGVGHAVRFFPEYIKARDDILTGKIGVPVIVNTFRGGMQLPRSWQNWYADFDKSGGVMLDLLIHDFDFLRWCFGEPERVFAKSTLNRTNERIEYALVTLRFKNGVIAHAEGSWSNIPGPFYTKFEICGDQGMITHDSRKSVPVTISVLEEESGPKGATVPRSPLKESPYLTEIRHFVECIEHDRQPMISFEEGYKSAEIVFAALQSVNTGEVVYL